MHARMLLTQGPEETLQAASQWLPPVVDLEGSEFHYNVFESLISGRSIYHGGQRPTDQFQRIFQAQLLKDEAMASKLYELMEIYKDTDDKCLVIAGNGHLLESIPLPDNSIDVVISNGAFCLAPNKEKAFREHFRVLKPGGLISICTPILNRGCHGLCV